MINDVVPPGSNFEVDPDRLVLILLYHNGNHFTTIAPALESDYEREENEVDVTESVPMPCSYSSSEPSSQ